MYVYMYMLHIGARVHTHIHIHVVSTLVSVTMLFKTLLRPMKQVLLSLFYRWGRGGSERGSNHHIVPQLEGVGTGFEPSADSNVHA